MGSLWNPQNKLWLNSFLAGQKQISLLVCAAESIFELHCWFTYLKIIYKPSSPFPTDGMETQKSQDQVARDFFFVAFREREAATILEVRIN